MNKIQILSPHFEGEVEATYGADNQLLLIDYQKVMNITITQVHYIKAKLPVVYDADAIKAAFADAPVQIISAEIEITPEMFWEKYDHKIRKDKFLTAWKKLKTKKDRINAYYGIDRYHAHLKANSWKTKLLAHNWLNGREWEGEY